MPPFFNKAAFFKGFEKSFLGATGQPVAGRKTQNAGTSRSLCLHSRFTGGVGA
ncbi:hypothetical protein SXCC_02588 [Gluconacetobacter sp. SXCC-1]|nr:hypothetical protein SXCC_02588 [Gluconacetobacter sp. SXCC-1]